MQVTLILTSLCFLFLTLPSCVYYLYYRDRRQMPNWESWAAYLFVSTLANHLWFVNASINFFLYCLTGTRFRYVLNKKFVLIIGPTKSESIPEFKDVWQTCDFHHLQDKKSSVCALHWFNITLRRLFFNFVISWNKLHQCYSTLWYAFKLNL